MPIQILRNDITRMQVDAIVNAANETLLGGGGVDGAIHRAAGPMLLEECRKLGGCQPGEAKITSGYNLPCPYVIHTVGPIWQGGHQGEAQLLRRCYQNSLDVAVQHNCRSIAFPLISAGVYGYPMDQAIKIAMDTVSEYLLKLNPEYDLTVYIVVFNKTAAKLSGLLFSDIQQFVDDAYVELHEDRRESRRRRVMAIQKSENMAAGFSPEPMEASMQAPRHTPSKAPSKGLFKAASLSLEDYLKEKDEGFAQALVSMIEKSGKKPSYIYKKANIDKKLYSKIVNNVNYHPSKETALAFAVALELDFDQTQAFIAKAGYALSHFSIFDIIVEYFIRKRHFSVDDINIALYDYDQRLLGN